MTTTPSSPRVSAGDELIEVRVGESDAPLGVIGGVRRRHPSRLVIAQNSRRGGRCGHGTRWKTKKLTATGPFPAE